MSATPSSSGVGRCGSVEGGAPESATPPSPSRETRTPVRPISAVSVASTCLQRWSSCGAAAEAGKGWAETQVGPYC